MTTSAISPEDFGNSLIKMIEETLNPKRWNFYLSFKEFKRDSMFHVVYDSEWCKVRFDFFRGHNPSHNEIHIYYGRLHALNDDLYIIVNKQRCRCWHNVVDTLYFVDGLSPIEAVEQQKRGKLPSVLEEFRYSEKAQRLREAGTFQYSLERQSVIWNHYGTKLFNVFDLRQSDLWEKYTRFISNFHEIKDSQPLSGYPPYASIC